MSADTLRAVRTVSSVDPADFRHACRTHAAGVVILTVAGPDGPVGFTASSFAGVSAEPPLVSFNMGKASSSLGAVLAADVTCIHLLGADDADLALRFAGPAHRRFDSTNWSHGPYGEPRLAAGRAHLVVAPRQFVDAGDHLVAIADLVEVDDRDQDQAPLVHSGGGFHRAERL